MRTSMLLFLLAVPLFNLPAYSEQCPVLDRMGGTYSMSVMSSDTGFAGDEENTGAYMGVDISDITPERVSALKLKDERGVEVTMVDQDAPAGKAGHHEGAIGGAAQIRRLERGSQGFQIRYAQHVRRSGF